MSDGAFHTVVAPRPPTASGRKDAVVRATRLARQLLFSVIVIFVLYTPAATATAAALSHQAAQVDTHHYAAWSCRGVYHVVRRGETIYSIARRYGTTAYRIAVRNGLASYTVYVGQTLLVPTAR